MSEGWSPPGWMYRARCPKDDGYFENMVRVIFQDGLSWEIIDKKWPHFKKVRTFPSTQWQNLMKRAQSDARAWRHMTFQFFYPRRVFEAFQIMRKL